jgi:TonB family protein
MRDATGSVRATQAEPYARDLQLLIVRDSWPRVFVQNFRALIRPAARETLQLESAPSRFWPDVFVEQKLPWLQFAQSAAYHGIVLTALWAGSRLIVLQPHASSQPAFKREDVVYYTSSEYLPPIDTLPPAPESAAKADPEYSAQPIISVPPEANGTQTLVTPPIVWLEHDVALPNLVAFEKMPADRRMPIGPAPAVPVAEISRLTPRLERRVIVPPASLDNVEAESQMEQPPQVTPIAPPPLLEANSERRQGDINIGSASVVAPAPLLPVDLQRALSQRSAGDLSPQSSAVIAPPPSVAATEAAASTRIMAALSLHPDVGAPPDPPPGNRRGSFAATAEGHRGASGEAGVATGGSAGANTSSGKAKANDGGLPSGLYVGKTSEASSTVPDESRAKSSNTYSVNPNLIASARPPRTLQTESESKLSQEERAVFGSRRFYSLTLNMPNLNSAGGSWIIRFAALKPDSRSIDSYSRESASPDTSANDLSAPSAIRKVDPAYPLELMRQLIGGTVILYAVIHADGTVGGVRVLRSVDDRLDRFASEAVAKWQFAPATKNGAPVDVEATFSIPFRPARSNF